MMTAYATIKDAVEAMRCGAFDYITKPFDLDEMLVTVHKALEIQILTEENIRLKKELHRYYGAPNIIGESKAMQAVFAILDKVSRTDSTVLILGESGTGKELIASTIHYQGARKDKPIIRVNCAALPAELIESELFGSLLQGEGPGVITTLLGDRDDYRINLIEKNSCLDVNCSGSRRRAGVRGGRGGGRGRSRAGPYRRCRCRGRHSRPDPRSP